MKIAGFALSLFLSLSSCFQADVTKIVLSHPRSWYWDDWAMVIPSPDLKTILFEKERKPFVRFAGSDEPRPLAHAKRLQEAVWVDGGRVEIKVTDENDQTMRWSCDHRVENCRTSGIPTEASLLSASPGGRTLVYWLDDALWKIDETGQKKKIVDGFPMPMSLAVSPDGQNAAYMATQERAWLRLGLIDSKSGKDATLAANLDGAWGESNIAWDGNGRILCNLVGVNAADLAEKHRIDAQRFLKIFAFDLAHRSWTLVRETAGKDVRLTGVSADGGLIWHEMSLDMKARVSTLTDNAAESRHQDIRYRGLPTFLPSWGLGNDELLFGVGRFRFADYTLSWDVVRQSLRNPQNAAVEIGGPGEDFFAKASPRGRWICAHSHRPIAASDSKPYYPWNYSETTADGHTTDGLWIYDSETKKQSLLVDLTEQGGEVGLFDWSPDGKAIVFENDFGGAWLIYLGDHMDQVGVPISLKIPGLEGHVSGVAWSPAHTTESAVLAIEESNGLDRTLWIARVSTVHNGKDFTGYQVTEARKVHSYHGMDAIGGVEFARDGQSIYFTDVGQGARTLQVYNFDLSSSRVSWVAGDPQYNAYNPQISRDSKQVAFSLVKREHSLFVAPPVK